MAGTTPNLALNKPSYEDRADVALLNANMDILDGFSENVQNSFTAEYDETSLYSIGAICVHNGKLKRCVSTISVAEEWNDDHWTDTTVLEVVANGLELPEFTDLNGFTFGGVYYGLDTLISTYSHVPVSSGSFTLFVSKRVESNTTVCTQLLIASDSKQLWSRVSKISNGSIAWSDWENYLMASQVKNNLTTSDTGYVLDASQGKQLSTSFGHMQDGLAIVANGNTHGAISSGQYVYVKNHSNLAEGMYTASTNVAANNTLSTSNLTPVSNGGLNALNGNIANINDDLGTRAKYASYDLPGGGTRYLNHSSPVLIFTDRGGMWTEGSAGRSLTTISQNSDIAVTRESNSKLKIVSSHTYSTRMCAIGFGDTLNFSAD